MTEITLGTLLSIITGILGHVVFYPVIEAWNNQRMRRLARPAIGVLLNAVPFLVWLRILKGHDKTNGHLLCGFAAYCISFLWNGTGVVLGYVIGDWKDGN